jgi:DNA repair protein RadC
MSLLIGDDYKKEMSEKQLIELFGYVRPSQDVSNSVQEAMPVYSIPEIHPTLAIAKELISRCMIQKINTEKDVLVTSCAEIKTFLTGKLSHLEHEVFLVLFLDNKHKILAQEIMFRGTISFCSVEPREIVKASLKYNAASVMFAHNHPSGNNEPSSADIGLTKKLTTALGTVDIKVLDHIIVANNEAISLMEKGLM